MTQDTQNVPGWFADFAERNAREHGELAKAISDSQSEIFRSEARTTHAISSAARWVMFAFFTSVIILTGIGVATAIIAALINANGS